MGGDSGIGVEFGGAYFADGCPVVVPGNADVLALSQQLDTFMRVRPIADHIAQAPDFFNPTPPLHILQHRGEGFQVGVNIGDNGIPHLLNNIAGFGVKGKGLLSWTEIM